MGSRKREKAEQRKEAKKDLYVARHTNCPTSPRKMRLVADLVRGKDVNYALNVLKFSKKEASNTMEKVLRSAIANFEVKSGKRADEEALFIDKVFVDSGRVLKRLQTAPQGRAYRLRKRSNHITMILNTKNKNVTE